MRAEGQVGDDRADRLPQHRHNTPPEPAVEHQPGKEEDGDARAAVAIAHRSRRELDRLQRAEFCLEWIGNDRATHSLLHLADKRCSVPSLCRRSHPGEEDGLVDSIGCAEPFPRLSLPSSL
jgi:hypothetical protein